MPIPATMDILKEAILLEKRGQAFYRKVAGQAADPAVKEFFETMADEEMRHIKILESQYASFMNSKKFDPVPEPEINNTPLDKKILSREIKQQIAAADFEAAAISAAILMEERAISLYSTRARETKDPDERALYQWLADWEQGHLSFLAQLDQDIKETIWNDNQFWPF